MSCSRVLALGCLLILGWQTVSSAPVPSPPQVLGIDDSRINPLQPAPGVKATVVIFTSTDCPISNRYAPELRRLHALYAPRGVRFWLVYPNPSDTADAIRAHLKEYDYPIEALRDPRRELVRLTGATVTPEAAVFHDGTLQYRGRIDDRYVEIGTDRPQPTTHDLADAIEAVLSARPIAHARTRAIGCYVSDVRPPAATVTFSRDIAPLVFERCGTCHRAGGPAPFSLLTYADVARRATLIADVTKRRYMPPWKSEPGYGDFVGQEHLTAAEIERFERWAREGAPEGEPSVLPAVPRFPDGWQLGQPDAVVTFPPYALPPAGTDAFRIFVLRIPTDSARFVRGLEFRPGNPRVVHHANIRIDPTPASRRLDEQDPEAGYDGLLAHTAVYPDGHFFGWTPGQLPSLLPKGLAWRLAQGTDLVVQVHMQPSGKPELVQPSIGLFFGTDPPERTPAMLRLGRQNIDIPAGDARYVIEDSYVLPVHVDVIAVQPHAHYRAKEIRGWAALPDQSTRPLIYIKDWDFRWQHVYRLKTPLSLPQGSRLSMRYTYDNSASNPRNPQQPPTRAVWGQRSADEMGDLWVQVVTRTSRDLTTLTNSFRPKVIAEDIAGYEMVIRSDPRNTALHDDVAMLYLDVGRSDEAVRHFRVSLELNPGPAANYNLATALTVAGRLDEAVEEYAAALRLDPAYANAHNNLAGVLISQGKLEDAVRHAREAIRLRPDNAEAHLNLSRAFETLGNVQDAIAHAREALQLKPGWAPALQQVARLLKDLPP